MFLAELSSIIKQSTGFFSGYTYLKFEHNKILQRIYFVQKSEKHLVYLEQDMQPAHLSSINHASLKQIIYKQKTTKP